MARGRKRPASALSAPDDRSSAEESGTAGADAAKAVDDEAPTGTSANEVRFGKHLASSDKRVRDRTVSSLREWLYKRSKGGSLTDLDQLKVCFLLRYCCTIVAVGGVVPVC